MPRKKTAPPEPQSFEAWYRAHHPEYQIAAYQLTYIRRLEQLARREGRRKLCVCLPPGDAKTTIGTLSFIPWYLQNNPGHHVMTVSYAKVLAEEFGADIRSTCNEAAATGECPGLAITNASRAKSHFETAHGNKVYALGFDGQIAGRRLDLCDIDDPVKNEPEAQSEATMNERYRIYRSGIRPRLKPGGITVMNLTRYGLRDFYARVMEAEPDEWDVLIFPAEDSDGKFLWEEYHGRTHYELEKRDQETWWSVWMQDPRAFVSKRFSPNWLCYYDRDPEKARNDPFKYPTYMICDPGRSSNSAANRTSIPVFSAGPDRRVFLVDWVLDRMDPGQRADAIVRLLRKWNPVRFIYEELGYVSDTFYLNERFEKENIVQRVEQVGRKGPRSKMSKWERIDQLEEWFSQSRLWLPHKLLYKQVDGHIVDLIKYFVEQEYIPYRGANTLLFDDALDSFSRLNDPELKLEFLDAPVPSDGGDSGYDQAVGRGTWEGGPYG